MDRKKFLQTSAMAGVGFSVMPYSILKGTDDRKVRLGFIGTGSRGGGHVRGFANRPDVEIPAICDIDVENAQRAQQRVVDAGKSAPELYTNGPEDYKNLVERDDLDGIVISTPWDFHVEQAIAGMKAGKYVAVEIPAAISLEGCWDLVNTYEETGVPLMPLHNTAYQRDVMAVLNMVRQGLFGELVHCQGGYQHNLYGVLFRENARFGPGPERNDTSDWRTLHNMNRNALLYPDHGTGAIGHWLDISRGNRYMTLSAFASKSVGLEKYIDKHGDENHPYKDADFKKGDIVTVTITTANGETVHVINDTTLPRGDNNKAFRVQGTNGLWQVEADRIYIEGRSPNHSWEDFDPYQDEFDSSVWKKHEAEAEGAGHGGKDWFVRNAFVQSIKQKVNPPIDVYSAVASAAIVPLSEESIAKGGEPVDFPDFTRGKWMSNKPIFLPEELGY